MNFNNAKLTKSCYLKNQLLVGSKKKEIVFVGRSNVGKSSIINCVLNRKKLARVSNVPGKTISINFYGTLEVDFVDFPGYGFAKIAKSKKRVWDELAEEYFSSKRNIMFAVLVLDARRGLKELDFKMIEYLVFKKIYFIVLINKIDKLKKTQLSELLNKTEKELSFLKNTKIILFSCKTKQGVSCFKQYVENKCEVEK